MSLRLPSPPSLAPGGRLWIGYSGGGDSTVLLHLAAASGLQRVAAVHVHHGLQPAADDWVRHCRRQCRALGVPLRVLRVRVATDGGVEAAARAARYTALAELLRPGDVFATAHHRDDQAETVLFRALRGTGIAGLGGMREREPLGAGVLWRPLLEVSRARLQAHARSHRLDWIEDPHNRDPRYARAFLRHAVLPQLGGHFPAPAESLARLAQHAQSAQRLLSTLADLDRERLEQRGGFDVAALVALEPERRDNLLYHAWRRLGLPPPDAGWYARIEREVLRARADGQPLLAHGAGEARRYRGRLYLLPRLPPAPAPDSVLVWGRRRRVRLPPGCGSLGCTRVPPAGVTLRFARGGERLKPAGSRHSRTLKNLCQEAGLPPWVRSRMPLVWLGDELIAVAGDWRSERAVALGLAFTWTHALPGV